MTHVLIMSSWTSIGHVGLSAAAPVLQALGHEVTQLPTVVLSNHPGWPRYAGRPVPRDLLADMIDAIDANGWLQGHDAVLIGYMPTAAHVTLARDLVVRLQRRGPVPTVVVDPVLGDDPGGLYVDETAAAAIRDELVPLADILTPNRFELGWLASRSVATLADVSAAASEMTKGPNRAVIVTSPPVRGGDTGAMVIGRDGETALFRTARLNNVPHGVGDAFSAMIAAGLDVGAALGHLQALVEASAGAEHLNIVGSVDRWRAAPAIQPSTLPFPGED